MNAEQIELVYVMENFINKENTISEKIHLANKAIDLLINQMVNKHKYNFPTNISELINFMKTENMDAYLGDDFPSEPFINYNLEVNEYILEETKEKDEKEKVQKIMKNLLDCCREKYNEQNDSYWDDEYKEARKFISNTYLIEKVRLDSNLELMFSNETIKMIQDMYIQRNIGDEKLIICPVCGKPLDFTNEKGSCTEICKYYRVKDKLEDRTKVINPKKKYVELSKGIYKYVLLPNIGEIKIYEKLCAKFKDLEVTLYPNIDEFDIRISNGDICINLDVKDHTNPNSLAKNLKENSNLSKFNKDKYCFLVIPDHRVEIYKKNNSKNYMNELNKTLQNEEIDIYSLQEKNLIKTIEEILEGI